MHKNNKGFSLVELLVALAVGSIVLSALTVLIQHSVKNFTRQTLQARLQSDADIVLNQIEDDIMEANMLIMNNEASDYNYYLTKYSETDKANYCGYIWDKNNKLLYYSTNFYPLSDVINTSNMSLACEHVEEFSIKIDKDCILGDKNLENNKVINSGIKVVAALKLSEQNVTREVSREISMRNSLYGQDLTDDIKIVKISESGKRVDKLKDYSLEDVKDYIAQ